MIFLVAGLIGLALFALAVKVSQGIEDGGLEFQCRQYGFDYADEADLAQLGSLASPPWECFCGGLDNHVVRKVVVANRHNGGIFSGRFNAILFSKVGTERRLRFSYTIVGLRISAPDTFQAIQSYVAGLTLKSGLRVVMYGDCVYALFSPERNGRLKMTHREQIDAVRAMTRLLEGDMAGATQLFDGISNFSPLYLFFHLPYLAAMGCAALAWNGYRSGEPGFLIVAGAIGLFCLYWVKRMADDTAELRAYLGSRS
jgi:hypothetical protein